MATQEKVRPGIQSVEIAGKILRALIELGRPAPLRDLAKTARMHPGKAHRYLVSLTRIGLVTQEDASGHYGVGPVAIALGLAGLRNVDVVKSATALLPSLRDRINETVLLAIWSPKGPVVFALEESGRPVYVNVKVGSILPISSTATGRVFAAFLPREMTAALLSAEIKKSPRSHAAFAKVLEQVRKTGIAAVQGALVPGICAIAAPLFDQKDHIAGVIGALGRFEDIDVSYTGTTARTLVATAAEISRRMGRTTRSQLGAVTAECHSRCEELIPITRSAGRRGDAGADRSRKRMAK
jgi:DNA-binding IclR family transcriptional regulator